MHRPSAGIAVAGLSLSSGWRRLLGRPLTAWLLWVGLGGAFAQPDETLPARWTGRVTLVSDGDTLWVRPESPESSQRQPPLKLRLLGLDAPERCQAGGPAAHEALRSRVLGRTVQVETVGRDVYQRLLGRVWLESVGDGAPADVGAWLVSEGHAWSDRYRGDPGPYAAQEDAARNARRGLFADAAAQPPRRFRREHGRCED